MRRKVFSWLLGCFMALGVLTAVGADGDPRRGAQMFRQCGACHSLELDRHLTGPSLAGVLGRAAGTATGFGRYSEALSSSGLTWDRDTLDRWLADPTALVPGTSMRVQPIDDAPARRDLIAFLAAPKDASSDGDAEPARGGMTGGMQGGRMPNLKEAQPNQRVTEIGYCGDAYQVTLGTGKTYTFWEFNLRFKSDSSVDGPPPGKPAIVGQGMMGDRAQVVFADPSEISAFVRKTCPDG